MRIICAVPGDHLVALKLHFVGLASLQLRVELIDVVDPKDQRVIHLKDTLVSANHVVRALVATVDIQTLHCDRLRGLRSKRIQTKEKVGSQDEQEQTHHCSYKERRNVDVEDVVEVDVFQSFDHANSIGSLKGQGNPIH